MRAFLACVLLVFVSPLSARAGLSFASSVLDVKADSGAAQLTIQFPFKNSGPETVTLFSTESDCGCTTATLDKKIFQPGESGAITVNFAIGDRVGPQEKKVRVRASDQNEPHVLTFKTNIPVFARVLPQFVYWANGEKPAPKSMFFEVVDASSPVKNLTAISNNPAIKPTVREVEKGRKFEIVITPGATEKFLLATIQLSAELGDNKPPRLLQAYATIKPGGPGN